MRNDIATRFKEGNIIALKWTKEDAENKFKDILDNAATSDTVLCLQDAILEGGLYSSGFYYLLKIYPELEPYKKDIMDVITSRINKGALTNKYVAAPAIWRLKQLGETDTVNHTNDGGKFEQPKFVVNSSDVANNIDKVLNGE